MKTSGGVKIEKFVGIRLVVRPVRLLSAPADVGECRKCVHALAFQGRRLILEPKDREFIGINAAL